ncbi:oxygenase MpaB family protein [Nonomuraea sp. NPDC047897]|uniref:oxygenase MpaB family protein n=1 Tax=Nonomuraea sp. NPDC047897 TaxID=3364346 RepID=UPI00371151B0
MTQPTDAPTTVPQAAVVLRHYVSQARWGLAATRASVLEAAHPQIGAALVGNSTFVARPWRRLRNTMMSTRRLVDDDEQVRLREAARLNRLHQRISGTDAHGRPYDAMDPEARGWVMATLFESTVTMCRLGGHPLDPPTQQRLYDEFREMLVLMGDDGSSLPATLQEFWPYYDDTISRRLEFNEAVHAVLHRVFAEVPPPPALRGHPTAWAAIRALAGPLATAITVASLPETYRRQARLTTPPGAQALMHGVHLAAGLATHWLPAAWTQVGTFMDVLDLDDDDDDGPGSRLLGALLHQASRVSALLQHLTADAGPPVSSARRSAERFFTEVLDQTGDGHLAWPDLAAMAREIATRLDMDAQTEARLFTAYADWWRELQTSLDTDGDGRITRHEYATAATTPAGPALIKIADVLFDATDTDGDQVISAGEHQKLFRTAFDHELTGGGGGLSRAAFVREFLTFMAGRHRSAAYDHLLTEG